MNTMSPEMEALKGRLKAAWMPGDYAYFARYLETGAQEFLERLNIENGTHMLDVACGAGQISLPAARLGAKVTGIDIASNLIEQAKKRAESENLEIRFDEGDAEMLPYPDAAFDLVVSLIGAIFAPRPERVASELLRVCRSGGKIAMANWTPQGHVGQMIEVIHKHVPPPPMPSPLKWGDEEIVRERLNGGLDSINCTKRIYPMKYPFPPAQVVELFFTYNGPTAQAFAALDQSGRLALRNELEELWTNNNRADDGSTYVESEYLEVLAIRA
jgi:SAM-dependent methyltransferase